MKNQELKEIKNLVKSFNEKNAKINDGKYTYQLVSDKYNRGRYSCQIFYDIFFSPDMEAIMTYCLQHKLLVRLSSFESGETYMSIQ